MISELLDEIPILETLSPDSKNMCEFRLLYNESKTLEIQIRLERFYFYLSAGEKKQKLAKTCAGV